MENLNNLEKKINSELGTKIKKTELKHNQIYIEITKDDLIEVILFLKTDKDTKFKTRPPTAKVTSPLLIVPA